LPSIAENFLVAAVDVDIKENTEKSFCILGEVRSIYEPALGLLTVEPLGDSYGEIFGDPSGEPAAGEASFPPVTISIYFSGERLGSGIVSIYKAFA